MKFIGKPQGVFMPGAPGGYDHNKVYMMRFRHSRYKWWQLMEEVPVLKAPELKSVDDVFSDMTYIPDEDITEEEEEPVTVEVEETKPDPILQDLVNEIARLRTQLAESEKKAQVKQGVSMTEIQTGSFRIPDPYAPAIIEPYMAITMNPEGDITDSKVVQEIEDEPEVKPEPRPEPEIEAVSEPVAVEKPDSETVTPDREELKRKLDEAGIIYGAKEHTTTLQKRVEELEAEE